MEKNDKIIPGKYVCQVCGKKILVFPSGNSYTDTCRVQNDHVCLDHVIWESKIGEKNEL